MLQRHNPKIKNLKYNSQIYRFKNSFWERKQTILGSNGKLSNKGPGKSGNPFSAWNDYLIVKIVGN